jgi:hypothetical protein
MSPAEREARLAELATGYALNQLSDAESQEFLGYLRDPVAGRDAARNAWSTLHTVTDLRAARSHALQDALRARLAADHPAASAVLPSRWWWQRWWRIGLPVLAVLVILGFIAAWLAWTASLRLAQVETVSGNVIVDGRDLRPGMTVDGHPLTLVDGGHATLRWPDGTRLRLTGPGTVLPQVTGALVLEGHAELTTSGAWNLALPDGAVRITASSRVLIEAKGGQSCLGVVSGLVIDAAEQRFAAGTCRCSTMKMPWTTASWSELPENLPIPPGNCWHLKWTTFAEASGTLTLTWADVTLVCGAQDVSLLRGDGSLVRAVRPPADRCLELDAKPWGFTVSLQGEPLLQTAQAPQALRITSSGPLPLKASFRSGPALPESPVP